MCLSLSVMSRVCKKAASRCTDDPLAVPELWQKFAVLRLMLSSCYGPRGRFKQIHNNVGGHVLTTSTSSVLLRALTFSEDLLKLVAGAVINHAARLGDCGLFTGIVCINLVQNARGMNLSAALATRVYRHLLAECRRYLRSESCGCRVEVDFSNVQTLITLARTVISSKRVCMLTPEELQHISSVTVQAFLLSVPSAPSDPSHSSGPSESSESPGRRCFGRTVTISLEGLPVGDSAVFPGLLLDLPVLQSGDLQRLGPAPYKIALFNMSLSGDLSDMEDAALEIHAGLNPDQVLLDQLLKLGEQVVRNGVVLFVCQRVIHPVLQQYLRERGLLVIERLGAALVEPLAQMTGTTMMSSIYSPIPAQAYGLVGGLRLHHRASKELLQLLPSGDPALSTVLLCHRNQTMLEELKVMCERAEHVLRLTLKEPYALLGGGCTETLLSAYIRYTTESRAAEVAADLSCSLSEVLLGTESFCRALLSVAGSLEREDPPLLMDLTFAHCWNSRTSDQLCCSCGLIMNSSGLEQNPINTEHQAFLPELPQKPDLHPTLLLDSFSAKISALSVAVEVACLLLDVKYTIKDVN
ncbi:McKusick-Kaufman/Bardet-Biedl syndromes putative chaperonin [Astyanax mexicanus]|uniref:McKusick-Kaufman/Bardet-Biedl syndromes putative chaperonin n=1 Tax=Astyanax mexicanus TaxID=7994 RepID=A0A8T2KS67_ASTMX|nr:McKusick-Kaufman/Bardet-Biedl syndromes putative chaperonin [Astyanax mexicanus]